MRFLHAAQPGIVHGDLKAQNVLVDAKFNAKGQNAKHDRGQVADFGLTQKKQLGAAGTPFWMAPELISGGVNSPRTDVYSFGIVLAEVYSGQDPYEGQDTEEVLRLVVDKAVRQRPTVDPGMIPGTMSLLM
ncbi:kinase-like domain-containing protein [Baffinella frigidus]|nr:kinase-like domain-containing protein [Cryptophyta sp. CCMP2293]